MAHELGCVSFLNSKPLIDSLVGRKEANVHFAVPAKLLKLVESGTVTTALMSVVDYQSSRVPLLLVPAGMIGCDGPTLTVRVYSRVPLKEIKTLYGDTDSHTSVMLARIILKERYGVSAELRPLARREKVHETPGMPEAMVLIGDKVVNASPDENIYRHQLDLGEEWKKLTGLPFVFAMWMIRRDVMHEEGPAIARLLDEARREGAKNTEGLLDRYAAETQWPRDLARRYFTEYLRYEVTAAARRGMEMFFQKAHALGLLPELRPIEYLEIPRQTCGMALKLITATQLTPVGMGAIAVVRVTTPDERIAEEFFAALTNRRGLAARPADTVVRTVFLDGARMAIDDGLLIRTAATQWELQVHGGIAVMAALLDRLRGLGVEVMPTESGDSESAESLLSRATTMTAARLMLAQPAACAQWAGRWYGWLRTARAGELWRFHAAVQWVLQRAEALGRLLNPPRIAIIGAPNAGKSTLANALLGRPAAITSDIAGTTRDWVEGEAVLSCQSEKGELSEVAVTLVDTAGIRETADPLESQSIDRTHAQARQADVIISLFDGTCIPTADELRLALPRAGQIVIPAASKSDLSPSMAQAMRAMSPVQFSAKTGAGLDQLGARILAALDLANISGAELLLASPQVRGIFRQLACQDDPAQCLRLLDQLTPQASTSAAK